MLVVFKTVALRLGLVMNRLGGAIACAGCSNLIVFQTMGLG